jgi:uncharacterized membrane protein YfcA
MSCLLACLVAYCVSLLTSTAGVSGAFLLLPFQVSVLGLTGPAITPTNLLFNIVATPSGIYRYLREGRMVWPLVIVITVGTVPGVVIGALARIYLLPDIRSFKLFAGIVLLFLGLRLGATVLARRPFPGLVTGAFRVSGARLGLRRLEYEFRGVRHAIATIKLGLVAAVIGIIGGIYGVGGGAIIAPILVAMGGLPIHSTAGATLLATFLTSVVGVAYFAVTAGLLAQPALMPDWWLGTSLGIGGLLGMYSGARLQRYLPARAIEAVLALATTGLGLSYVIGYLRG